MKNIICLDIETTGVHPNDEILQIGIIDGNFKTLFNEYIKPTRHTEWPAAMEKNKITPAMVNDKKTIEEQKDKLIDIFNKADVIIGYNSDAFDIPFLERELDYKFKVQRFDVMKTFMKEFALHKNERFTLINVAKLFNIEYENAHDALADVIVTLKVFYKMAEEAKKPKLNCVYKMSDGKEIFTKGLADDYAKKTNTQIVGTTYIENEHIIPENEVKSADKYRVGNFEKDIIWN